MRGTARHLAFDMLRKECEPSISVEQYYIIDHQSLNAKTSTQISSLILSSLPGPFYKHGFILIST